jgi:predicted chitinase
MNLVYNPEKFDSSLNFYRELFSNTSNIPTAEGNEQQYESSILIPLDFSLEMDGISGIIPNSAFEVPSNVLPTAYLTQKKESKIAFILHTVDHNFNNNKWTTKITGQTLLIRFDPLSAEEIERRKKAKEIIKKKRESRGAGGGNGGGNGGDGGNFKATPGCTKRAVALLSSSSVKSNISLIAKAAKDFGITGKNAIAAMCAIAGGECGLIPKSEGHIYKKANLQGVFTGLTADQVTRATAKGVTKKQFFSIVYGEYKPSRIGNRKGKVGVSDGGLYYGRGFNQLTGHGNYTNISNILVKKFGSKYNILENPELMNQPDTSAKALVAFYIGKMRGVDQNSDSWFTIARRKTGNDANGGYAKKAEYYNCLMSDKKDLIA